MAALGRSISLHIPSDIVQHFENLKQSGEFRDGFLFRRKKFDVPCRGRFPLTTVLASSAEPKWKKKLAAADEHAEKTRQLTLQAQEEYKKKQAAIRRQQAEAGGDILSLSSIDYISYLNDEGKITDCSRADAKASVYAIFDEKTTLQYIGISRQVYQSMRLHLARMPSLCYFVKLQHLTRPSRGLLESIRDKWIAENGICPPGNDNGIQQNLWENPLDCKLVMTEEEKQKHEDAAPGPPKARVLKDVARRVEKDLEACFEARRITEKMRFDPKLKDRGLLDLKNPPIQPDTSIPTTTLKTTTPALPA